MQNKACLFAEGAHSSAITKVKSVWWYQEEAAESFELIWHIAAGIQHFFSSLVGVSGVISTGWGALPPQRGDKMHMRNECEEDTQIPCCTVLSLKGSGIDGAEQPR